MAIVSALKGATPRGHPRVTQLLVDNYREFLRFLERRVGGRDVAEDILQETFARCLDKLDTVREDEALLAWFYRALRNATVDFHRRANLADRAAGQLADVLDSAAPAPETVLAKGCQCATRLVDTLKPEYTDALQRIEVEGASLGSFAEARGISKSNAAVRVFRAREALRRELTASCGTHAAHGCTSCACGTND